MMSQSERTDNLAYSDTNSEMTFNERQMLNIEQNSMCSDYKRVESKDSMWKPAPIIGREMF